MSTVLEPSKTGGFVAKNTGNGAGTALGREVKPLGLNAQKDSLVAHTAGLLPTRNALPSSRRSPSLLLGR